ncbi:MAG: hypothetical protein AAFZ15_24200 [Bacteroidota bacterium]
MKSYLFLPFLLFLSFSIRGQERLIDQQADTLHYKWDLQNGQFVLQAVDPYETNIEMLKVTCVDGDILIGFKVDEQPKNRHARVRLGINMDGDNTSYFAPPTNYLSGDMRIADTENGREKTIHWHDVLDRYSIFPGDEMSIALQVSGYESPPRRVMVRPEFKFKQTWPHYVAFAGGASLVAFGFIERRNADDVYEEYKSKFFAENAEPLYQEANDTKKRGTVMVYAGGSILLVNTILFYARWNRYRINKNIYHLYFEQPGLSFQPTVEPATGMGYSPGFRLVYTF